jgi:ribose transport system substrate-binding protein
MRFTGSRTSAVVRRAGSLVGKGRWKILLATLLIPASLLVSGGAANATSTHQAATHSTASAHTTYESLAWFKTQLAKDYNITTAGVPPTSAPAHKKGEKVWIISCGQASTGCAEPTANAITAGKLLGWQMTTCDGNFGIANGYNVCINKAIAAGANAVAVVSTDCNQAYAGMLQLKADHIPLVGSEGFDCSNSLGYISKKSVFTGNIKYTKEYPTALALNEEAGRQAADYLVVHDNGNVNVINSDFSVVAGEYADLGFVQELAKCQTCKILDTINYTPPDTPAGGTYQTEFAAALAANPTANAAYNWPDAIVDEDGQISAVDSIGKGSTFCIVTSQDSGGPTNDEAIANGNAQCADGAVDVVWNGYSLIDEVIRALDGQPSAYEGAGPLLISKGHNLGTLGVNWAYPNAGKGDSKIIADYKKIWGVS